MALEPKELPVALPAVSRPAMDWESHPVARRVALELDINTSTGSEQLRRVLKQVKVVVVAFGRGSRNQALLNWVVASGIERMATKHPPNRQHRSARSTVTGDRVDSVFGASGDESTGGR